MSIWSKIKKRITREVVYEYKTFKSDDLLPLFRLARDLERLGWEIAPDPDAFIPGPHLVRDGKMYFENGRVVAPCHWEARMRRKT